MIIVPLGENVGERPGITPGEYVPHPRVIRRKRDERPQREDVEPALERVPPAPRRGWSAGLRAEVHGEFRRLGLVDHDDSMVSARNERRVTRG